MLPLDVGIYESDYSGIRGNSVTDWILRQKDAQRISYQGSQPSVSSSARCL